MIFFFVFILIKLHSYINPTSIVHTYIHTYTFFNWKIWDIIFTCWKLSLWKCCKSTSCSSCNCACCFSTHSILGVRLVLLMGFYIQSYWNCCCCHWSVMHSIFGHCFLFQSWNWIRHFCSKLWFLLLEFHFPFRWAQYSRVRCHSWFRIQSLMLMLMLMLLVELIFMLIILWTCHLIQLQKRNSWLLHAHFYYLYFFSSLIACLIYSDLCRNNLLYVRLFVLYDILLWFRFDLWLFSFNRKEVVLVEKCEMNTVLKGSRIEAV